MTAGDIVSDMFVQANTTGIVVQPAVGVKVLITWMGGGGDAHVDGVNASGTNEVNQASGVSTGTNSIIRYQEGAQNMKLFLTNTQYIRFRTTSGVHYVSYTGIEL
ncbi:MAG: hypothetical protein [Circular genetic element sp.]|nr:MAG: hypothetical protein [Circular genetic element sp.]